MRAIILAAGESHRLGQLTRDMPKCLLEVGNRTLLSHQITALRAEGIEKIAVVTGHGDGLLRQAGGDSLEYIFSERYASTNSIYSLWLARHATGNSGFVLLNGDVLYHPGILSRLLGDPREDVLAYDPDATLADEEMKIRLRGDRIDEISKDLAPEAAHGENLGLLKFGAEGATALFSELESIVAEGIVRTWAPFAFDRLCRSRPLYVCSTDGLPWIEIDYPEDLERARTVIWPRISSS